MTSVATQRAEQPRLDLGLDIGSSGPPAAAPQQESAPWDGWQDAVEAIRAHLRARSADAAVLADAALVRFSGQPDLLLLGALAACATGRAARALTLIGRYEKGFRPNGVSGLLAALALAMQDKPARARQILVTAGIAERRLIDRYFIGDDAMLPWVHQHLDPVLRPPRASRPAPPSAPRATTPAPPAPVRAPGASQPPPAVPDLPRLAAPLQIARDPVPPVALPDPDPDGPWFALRTELLHLGLFEGFDELLCLPTLTDVAPHWYQIETVRKVLRTYRGRVLLADEVGLGKTIEAGMIVKEYVLRGMAGRILILTPAALVGQWREEMAGKFGLHFATTHDTRLREDPDGFWRQDCIIASIAAARRKEHAAILTECAFDAVVVDEAHHLRDQAGASYRLVSALQKRFLLLLSATPVQNNLIELYNLLTLLKPGIFRTQKEFRAQYMLPGRPREPVNQDRLRELMRGVMIRNTRALAALRLPRRHAATQRLTPGTEEAGCYAALGALVRANAAGGAQRLTAQHLLTAGGSSPAAAAAALTRCADRAADPAPWRALAARYGAVGTGCKEAALVALLARNPDEKKIVFVHQRASQEHLAAVLTRRGIRHVRFDGGMSGPEKDRAVAAFGADIPVLLASESGGEGRNLQFCNTLINFDIPWNPMAIEQRIGRIDRIGQVRDVFVFNLVTAGTIEDAVLRILDEKINMFELVVGEVGAILGELAEDGDFSTLVLDAWLAATEDARSAAFAGLETRLLDARRHYEDARTLDEALFGNTLDAA